MTDKENTKPIYDPKTYWANREHPNTAVDAGIGIVARTYLGGRIKGAESLLEIGPGVGRLFPLYVDVPRVCTLDISRNYTDRAAAAAAKIGLSVEPYFRKGPDDPFPFVDREFEVGVFSHVLQHIPFEHIEHTMDEAARCCRRVIVLTGSSRSWPRKGIPFKAHWHCFRHDYAAIAQELGCTYEDEQKVQPEDPYSGYSFVFARRA